MNNEILNKLGAHVLKGDKTPNNENELKKIESFLKIELSETHKSILNNYGGAIVFDEGAKYKPKTQSPVDDPQGFQNIEVFYGVLDDDNGLLNQNKMYSRQLPSTVITIGEAPGGNQICINRQDGRVLFWHHEAESEDKTLFEIAPSFDEFFSQLEPDNGSQPSVSSGIDDSESWLDI